MSDTPITIMTTPYTAPPRAVLWIAVSSRDQAADDKVSLADQERRSREACAREGWQVVDVLTVPGHSREYIDIHECAADMQREGIDAFTRLIDHWKRRDFDVLVAYDADRFARTQTLHAYVTETTIRMGAILYSINDGRIDASNYRMWIAMAGYKAASHIDRIRAAKKAALLPALERGLNTTGRCPLSHRPVRGPNGKLIRFEPNPDVRPLIDAATALLLQGVGWSRMSYLLAEQGFVSASGKPYFNWTAIFHAPMFHGSVATGFAVHGVRNGLWMFDASIPPPPGVTVVFDKVEPFYEEGMLRRVQDELRRRDRTGATAHAGASAYMFSGLISCAYCGRTMIFHRGYKTNRYYVCRTPGQSRTICANINLREDVAVAYTRALLTRLSKRVDDGVFVAQYLATPDAQPVVSIDTLERERADLQSKMRRLVSQQALTDDPAIAALYAEELAALNKRRQTVDNDLRMRAASPALAEAHSAEQAILDYKQLTPAKFWALPPPDINRLLHRVLGRYVLKARAGKVIGIALRKK